MLFKPQVITIIPGTAGQAGRDASYECVSYESGGAPDGGTVPPPDGGAGSGVRFSGVGTPYTPLDGEQVYVDADSDGYWNEQTITDAGAYTCVYGTSEPVSVNGETTYITAPFCTYTG